MPMTSFDDRVAAVRHFNRFYTRRIGVLDPSYLHSPFSLAEVRVLYELAHNPPLTAAHLARELELDPGYLSRILARFARRGFLDRIPSERDGREQWLRLTDAGRAVFEPLEREAREQIGSLLAGLTDPDQQTLVSALDQIESLLGEPRPAPTTFTLRAHRAGDMGWVVQRHGALYAAEYGFDAAFEGLVAGIVSKFLAHLDPSRERCWIAESDGRNVGCVFLVKGTRTIAKLRLFLIEPAARGQGLGRRLVDECVRFARDAGYRRVRLWTQSNLLAARHVYERAGFRRIAEERHHSFSQDLVAETWELRL